MLESFDMTLRSSRVYWRRKGFRATRIFGGRTSIICGTCETKFMSDNILRR